MQNQEISNSTQQNNHHNFCLIQGHEGEYAVFNIGAFDHVSRLLIEDKTISLESRWHYLSFYFIPHAQNEGCSTTYITAIVQAIRYAFSLWNSIRCITMHCVRQIIIHKSRFIIWRAGYILDNL